MDSTHQPAARPRVTRTTGRPHSHSRYRGQVSAGDELPGSPAGDSIVYQWVW